MPLDQGAADYLPYLAANTHGFVGADLMEVCREAGLGALRRNSEFLKDYRKAIRFEPTRLSVKQEDFAHALQKAHPSAMREVLITLPSVRWQDIGGLKRIKERLKELIEMPLKKPDLYEAMKINCECGIILHGPSGTGKTLLAKALANECGLNFIPLEGPEFFGQWLGESEEAIRHVFHVARLTAPTIIFFDQIEAVAATRERDSESRTTARVVSQLLTELDGIEPRSGVVVLAATNRLDMVDPSVLRSGRFGTHIFVPLPDEAERADILSIHMGGALLSASLSREELLGRLAKETAGFSGAELKYLCDEAKLASLRRSGFTTASALTASCFEQALAQMTNDLTKLKERGHS